MINIRMFRFWGPRPWRTFDDDDDDDDAPSFRPPTQPQRWFCLTNSAHTSRTHFVRTSQKLLYLTQHRISAFCLFFYAPASYPPSPVEPWAIPPPTPSMRPLKPNAVYGQTSNIAMSDPSCLRCTSSADQAKLSIWRCQKSGDYVQGGERSQYIHFGWVKLLLWGRKVKNTNGWKHERLCNLIWAERLSVGRTKPFLG